MGRGVERGMKGDTKGGRNKVRITKMKEKTNKKLNPETEMTHIYGKLYNLMQ